MPYRDAPAEGRQRRLDDLFGDEPFLSPTMRARRLVTGDHGAQEKSRHAPAILAHVPDLVVDRQDGSPDKKRSVVSSEPALRPYHGADFDETEFVPTARLLRTAEALVDRKRIREAAPPLSTSGPEPQGKPAPTDRPILRMDSEPGRETVRLSEAAALLRSEPSSRAPGHHADLVERLRSEVLLRWLKELPPRRAQQTPEER